MKLTYPDSVIIVDPVHDSYGAPKIGRMETVKAIVGQVTGFSHSSNQDAVTADSVVYLDHEDDYVLEVYKRLEGMYLITSEGEAQTDAWYQIISVSVGRKSLTTNTLDNVQLSLNKAAALPSVS